MEQRRVPHTWRTREDPLEGLWPKALGMLRDAPELEAKALFEHLLVGSPGTVSEKHLRTFQRRVRRWRLAEGPEQEVFFTQDHKPGGVLAVDWTDMGGLGITIQGRALVHKLFHAVLPYSNWEWAVRAHSESTLSLRGGLKATLGRLGRVPRELLTDHSSTATHQLKRGLGTRVFNVEYLGICEHFGITPRTINVGRPQENGSCESAHGHLKRRIRQHLLLRGSGDFASEEEYDGFLTRVLESANLRRAARLGEELAAMGETAVAELPDYREVMVSVRSDSTIRINKMVYSVPSRLIGVKLLARVDENHVVLLEGAQEVARLPLSRGDRGAVIDFRHLIGHLLGQPAEPSEGKPAEGAAERGTIFLAWRNSGLGTIFPATNGAFGASGGAPPLPSLELSVWNRVEARAGLTRDAGIPAPHKAIPRRRGLVGARIERDHFAQRFRLEAIARFSHWPSLGRMPNHFSASCSVVSSR